MTPQQLASLREMVGATPVRDEHAEPAPYVALVRTLRREKGWTGAELARRCEMDSSRVLAYERGARQPTAAVLAEIFDALGYEFRVVPKEATDG